MRAQEGSPAEEQQGLAQQTESRPLRSPEREDGPLQRDSYLMMEGRDHPAQLGHPWRVIWAGAGPGGAFTIPGGPPRPGGQEGGKEGQGGGRAGVER